MQAIVVFLLFVNLFFGFNAANANSEFTENKSQIGEQYTEAITSKTPTLQNKKILWDFRKVNNHKAQNFSKAETDAVLKYLVGENWDKDLAITSRVSGAFTKPDVKETLYFVSGCKDESGKFVSNSTCGHVGWDSAGLIAVYDGTTPIMKIEEALGYAIEKVTDVNGDGINEILSFAGYGGMGITTGGGALGQISGGKYQSIKEFRGYADNCASSEMTPANKKSAKAAVISYILSKDGAMPKFTEEYFSGKCEGDNTGKNSKWKRVTKKEFEAFSESIS